MIKDGDFMSGTRLLELIKLAGMQANETLKPVNVFSGKVIGIKPLEIEIEQTNRIKQDFLEVSEHLTNHFIYTTGVEDNFTDVTDKSKYEIRKKYILYNELKVGDTVILVRVSGGQKYYVMDRTGAV